MLMACLIYTRRNIHAFLILLFVVFLFPFLHLIRCVEASTIIFASCSAFSVFIVPLCDGSDDAVIGQFDGWIMGTMTGAMGLID